MNHKTKYNYDAKQRHHGYQEVYSFRDILQFRGNCRHGHIIGYAESFSADNCIYYVIL